MLWFQDLDLSEAHVLLCDADGNLYPSEEPAFVASAEVTNAFLAAYQVPARFTAEELRLAATGRNFRTTAVDLCVAHGVRLHPDLADRYPGARTAAADDDHPVLTRQALEDWVAEENRRVTAHLGRVLRPDVRVLGPLTALDPVLTLASVSSSAMSRLDACFTATGLATLIPGSRRYSAEDSLPTPTSKPDPAVYLLAGRRLGCSDRQALAVEDSVPGARSALAAGFPIVGNVMFVAEDERHRRIVELRQAGVAGVAESWQDVADLVLPARH
jgi:beta-phosphoglucomutase-like phosphatase (HAD superfamily)